MTRLILSIDGTVLKEFSLVKERTTIGRRPHSDIHIDNLAISGEHAVIISTLGDDFLQDLDSTNGTFVNGQAIKKHLLVDGDVIGLGKYRLKYFSETTTLTRRSDVQEALRREAENRVEVRLAAPDAGVARRPAGEAVHTASGSEPPLAQLEVLNGSNAGQTLQLTKARSVIGKPAVLAVAIDRRPGGYFLCHLGGEHSVLLNGRMLVEPELALADQDVIELAGVRMAFQIRD